MFRTKILDVGFYFAELAYFNRAMQADFPDRSITPYVFPSNLRCSKSHPILTHFPNIEIMQTHHFTHD